MPNKDGTGPQGKGPRTGRGMGNCSGQNDSENLPLGCGRGFGQGNRRQTVSREQNA